MTPEFTFDLWEQVRRFVENGQPDVAEALHHAATHAAAGDRQAALESMLDAVKAVQA